MDHCRLTEVLCLCLETAEYQFADFISGLLTVHGESEMSMNSS